MAEEPSRNPAEERPENVRRNWLERRREKVIAEIERNRRGEYKVPTWVLVGLLMLIVAGWAALVIFA